MSAPHRCHDCQHRPGPRVATAKKAPCGCVCHVRRVVEVIPEEELPGVHVGYLTEAQARAYIARTDAVAALLAPYDGSIETVQENV